MISIAAPTSMSRVCAVDAYEYCTHNRLLVTGPIRGRYLGSVPWGGRTVLHVRGAMDPMVIEYRYSRRGMPSRYSGAWYLVVWVRLIKEHWYEW